MALNKNFRVKDGLELDNDILFLTDNTHDIGASGGSRPANIYASANIQFGGNLSDGTTSISSFSTTLQNNNTTIPTGAAVQAAISGAGGMSNLSDDTTPQLGGNLDVNSFDIISASNGTIDLNPDGSGTVVFIGNATRGSGQFKLNCEQNTHAITIKGPPHSAAANYTLTLPNTDGSANQVLKTDGSGNLDWVDQTTGVGTTGTPANDQIAIFTNATTIEGVAGLTFDGTKLSATEIQGRAVSGSTTTGTIGVSEANTKITMTGNITIPAATYSTDDVILFDADGNSTRTLTPGSGLTLYVNGETVTNPSTVTLPANGLVSVAFRDASTAIVTGIETSPNIAPQTTTTTATTANQTVWSIPYADYEVVKLTVKIKRGNELHASEILVTHDGNTAGTTGAVGTEYATIFTGAAALATFDVALSGSNLVLQATPASATSTVFTVQAAPVIE